MRSGIAFSIIASIIFCAPAFGYDWSTNPGDGSPENPYQISEPNQLNAIGANANLMDKNFILVNDIDLSGFTEDQFNIIGNATTKFTGIFEGNGYVIRNFTYDADWDDYCGMFRCTGAQAILRNVILFNVNVRGDWKVGALVGENRGTIANCKVSGQVHGYYWEVGGLVGYSASGVIKDCISNASVISEKGEVGGLIGYAYGTNLINCLATGNVTDTSTGGGETGGLAGYARNCQIKNCSATGNVVSSATIVGGLVGLNQANIENCFAAGNVTAAGEAGGLVGRSWDTPITISDCYATGDVYADEDAGGFAGWAVYDQSFINCYCTGIVTAFTNSGSFIGGVSFYSTHPNSFANCFSSQDANPTLNTVGWLGSTNLPGNPEGIIATTIQSLKTQSTFTDVSWDFVGESTNGENEIWRMCVDGVDYPRLSWEFAKNGDFACADGVDLADFLALAEHWLMVEAASPTTFNYACDANGDEEINLGDFGVLAEHWE